MSTLTSAIENHSLEEILDIKHTSVSIEFSPTSHYMPGLFTSFLQVLCSKIRTLKEFEISTNLSEKNQDQILDNFHNYYHLLTLLLFKYDLNIRDKNGFLLKRDLLITIAIQQFNLQEELYS